MPIKIPEELIQIVKKVIKENKELGYRSPSEFVIDAVRRRVEKLITNNNQEKILKIDFSLEKKIFIEIGSKSMIIFLL
ncbi:hypothetical protein LCGC14_1878940 [marine sediment metagenome]|uniref:Ribbon-helix-helix protein CopG domain-containing protein n=1 Tax=marine sediment metagenome TaxID=412755 RepID=A0A0F9GQY9_9ZZZZ